MYFVFNLLINEEMSPVFPSMSIDMEAYLLHNTICYSNYELVESKDGILLAHKKKSKTAKNIYEPA